MLGRFEKYAVIFGSVCGAIALTIQIIQYFENKTEQVSVTYDGKVRSADAVLDMRVTVANLGTKPTFVRSVAIEWENPSKGSLQIEKEYRGEAERIEINASHDYIIPIQLETCNDMYNAVKDVRLRVITHKGEVFRAEVSHSWIIVNLVTLEMLQQSLLPANDPRVVPPAPVPRL